MPNSVVLRLAVAAFWALGGAALSRGLTLLSSLIAARMLGTEAFGEIGMIQSTQGLLGVLAGAGLGLAATKFVAEHRTKDADRAWRCVSLGIGIAWLTGAIAAVILIVLSGPIAANVLGAPHLAAELQVAAGLVLFGTINGVQTGALVGYGDFRTIALLHTIRGGCLCLALIMGITLGGVMGGVIALVATEFLAVVANHFTLLQFAPNHEARSGDRAATSEVNLAATSDLAELVKFSVLSLLGSICTTSALWYGNVVLVSQTNGYAALGIFNAADRWRQLLLFLPASLSPVILSMLANLHGEGQPGSYRRLFGINLTVSIAVVTIPSVGFILWAETAMALFGDDYREGATTLVVLALSALVVVLNNLLGQILVSRGAIMGRFLLDVLLAAVLAIASWHLVPMDRELGLAWGSLIAYGTTAVALVGPAIYLMKRSQPALLDSSRVPRETNDAHLA